MTLTKMKENINKTPKNSPDWIKQCYKTIIDTKHQSQEITLQKLKEILNKQDKTEIKNEINKFNAHNTNLLWVLAYNGKSTTIQYLIENFDASAIHPTEQQYDIFEGYGIYSRCTASFDIIDISLLHADPIPDKKNRDDLNTVITLAKHLKISLHKIKFPTLGKKHITGFYGPSGGGVSYTYIKTPAWLIDEIDRLDKENTINNKTTTQLCDIQISCQNKKTTIKI